MKVFRIIMALKFVTLTKPTAQVNSFATQAAKRKVRPFTSGLKIHGGITNRAFNLGHFSPSWRKAWELWVWIPLHCFCYQSTVLGWNLFLLLFQILHCFLYLHLRSFCKNHCGNRFRKSQILWKELQTRCQKAFEVLISCTSDIFLKPSPKRIETLRKHGCRHRIHIHMLAFYCSN